MVPSDEEILAQLAEARRIPEPDEVRNILENHFVGPIDDVTVARLHTRLREVVADSSLLRATHAAFASNSSRYWGHAWKEVLSPSDERPSHRVLIAWLAVTTRGYPAPKPHCSPDLVGAWKQLAPSPSKWQLGTDGELDSDEPSVAGYTSWCVHEVKRVSQYGSDELRLTGPRLAHPRILVIVKASPTAMELYYPTSGGRIDYRLAR